MRCSASDSRTRRDGPEILADHEGAARWPLDVDDGQELVGARAHVRAAAGVDPCGIQNNLTGP